MNKIGSANGNGGKAGQPISPEDRKGSFSNETIAARKLLTTESPFNMVSEDAQSEFKTLNGLCDQFQKNNCVATTTNPEAQIFSRLFGAVRLKIILHFLSSVKMIIFQQILHFHLGFNNANC